MDAAQKPIASLRQESRERIGRLATPEVLVLGGGVNGVAVLRELALNGVSAVLLDEGDFAAGASSASSRMAHGGLRYLEGREFRLVAESTRERNRLLANAGHLTKPLEICVPLEYRLRGFGRATLRFLGLTRQAGPLSLAALTCALALYEAFGRRERVLPGPRWATSRGALPKGMPGRILAAVSYFDGQIVNPEGLILEMLGEAMAASDRVAALNHAGWTFLAEGAEAGSFEIADRFGAAPARIRPRIVINATGAWIDRVNGRLGLRTAYVRCVKGAHLVLGNARLRGRMAGRAFYFDDGTGRMIIALPVGERVLIGTTEVETADPDDSSVSGAEIAYLLAAASRLFADVAVTRDDIVSVTSGIRPLRAGSSASATRAGRDHALEVDRIAGGGLPLLSLVGGKWTTFRAFAEQASDRTLTLLGQARAVSTAHRRYPGVEPCRAEDIPALPRARAEQLIGRYGALAREAAGYCAGPEDRPIAGAPGYSTGEMRWQIAARGACTLADLVLRRSQIGLEGVASAETLADLGRLLVADAGRSPEEVAQEIAAAATDPRIGARAGEGAA